MKIVIAADGHSEIHERACAAALTELGHEVREIYWAPRFRSVLGIGSDEFRSFAARVGNRFIGGPIVSRYNADVLALCERENPDIFLAYRGTHLLAGTLRRIRSRTDARLVSINNDDPFSPAASRLHWRHLIAGIPYYDVNFVYRHRNIADYEEHGGRNVRLLRSFYIPARNHPLDLTDEQREKWGSDVVFAGHWEDDGREATVSAVVEAGLPLRIYGPEWRGAFARNEVLRRLPPPVYLDSASYNLVLNASRIVLSFLSTLNRDTYTRRCFEVPASGAFLLSQYSDDLRSLFDEGKEIEFFRSTAELIDKIRHYLAHDDERRTIARAAYERVRRDGHDVVSRMRQMLQILADTDQGRVRARP